MGVACLRGGPRDHVAIPVHLLSPSSPRATHCKCDSPGLTHHKLHLPYIMGDSPFQAPALQVLWQAIVSDPMNFQSWTALLSQVCFNFQMHDHILTAGAVEHTLVCGIYTQQ